MRLAMMGGIALALVGFFIFLLTRLGAPQMTLLYGELSTDDSSRIVSQLESMNVPFEIRQNGSQVYVPDNRVLRLRLNMAEQGLPSGGSIGYEIFDSTDTLGTTNFMQNVNLVRALEGELARTIMSLDAVRSARVHVVMPRRQLFSRARQEPSASVVLSMGGPGRLSSEQVAAIHHLAAAAVPGLSPNRISVVDDKGSLLARGFDDGDEIGMQAAKTEERRRSFENRMAHGIEELLENSVGFGNVQATVSADIDFDRIATNEETFDPDGQVVRSTQSIEETASSREAETPPVSVATNLPDVDTGPEDGASATSAESRTEETVNFEISKKVINHVREAGLVKRLSVAVLVDGTWAENDDGDRVYQARKDEEMDLLATLVRSAIGFNTDRGDAVEVINMRFAQVEEPPEPPLELFFGFDKNDLLRMAEIAVMGIMAVLVILLVVRPLLSRAFEAIPAMASAAAGEGQLLADQPGAPALAGPERAPGEEEGFDELIDIDRVEGRVRASSVKRVGEIVDKHPEEALSIVRAWMYQDK